MNVLKVTLIVLIICRHFCKQKNNRGDLDRHTDFGMTHFSTQNTHKHFAAEGRKEKKHTKKKTTGKLKNLRPSRGKELKSHTSKTSESQRVSCYNQEPRRCVHHGRDAQEEKVLWWSSAAAARLRTTALQQSARTH